MMPVSNIIRDDIRTKRIQKQKNIDNFKQELLVVDAQKEPYDEAVRQVDLDLLGSINKVNDSIYATANAYQARVDSGCYSDLFWRVTGYSGSNVNIIVDQLNPVGYGYTISYVEPTTGGITSYSSDTKIGFTTQYLYGLKYYDQPYLYDIGDTTVGTFVGTIGLGSTILTIISQTAAELAVGFQTGNVIICTKPGVFASTTNTIVGFGTTVVTGISTVALNEVIGIGTSSLYTTTIILKDPTVGFSSLPEADGSYANYTVVISPEEIQTQNPRFKYQVKFTKNPYSPETIGILDQSIAGKGYKVKLDNSGYPPTEQSWKPELKGTEKNGETVKPPNVGAGRTYFRVGFNYRPVVAGNPVPKGTVATNVLPALLTSYYGLTPSCSGSISSGLSSAISSQATKEASLNGPCAVNLAEVGNGIRDERNEYALRIWGMRQSIGNQNDEIDKLEALDTYINGNSSVIDGETSSSCVQ